MTAKKDHCRVLIKIETSYKNAATSPAFKLKKQIKEREKKKRVLMQGVGVLIFRDNRITNVVILLSCVYLVSSMLVVRLFWLG